jgi:hypothetical protein
MWGEEGFRTTDIIGKSEESGKSGNHGGPESACRLHGRNDSGGNEKLS